MKKFLSVMVLAVAIIFAGNNFANAQDIYAGSTGGLDFYVDTNSINLQGSGSFYVNVKKINSRTGNLKETNEWKFYKMTMDGESSPIDLGWYFDYYLSGKMNPIENNSIAKEILSICQRHNRNIER